MYAFIRAFVNSSDVLSTHLDLKVMPRHATFALTGYIELKKYEKVEAGEDPHAGGHTKQIKAFLKALPEGEAVMVSVKTHPSLRMGKELSYEFSVGRKFDSEAQMQIEVEKLRKDLLIDEYTAPVFKHKEEMWVSSDNPNAGKESVVLPVKKDNSGVDSC
jgi:hypothetical protein